MLGAIGLKSKVKTLLGNPDLKAGVNQVGLTSSKEGLTNHGLQAVVIEGEGNPGFSPHES